MTSRYALGALGVVAAGAGAALVARSRFRRARARLANDLFADARPAPDRAFDRGDLDDLPDPVRNYLDTVLAEGQPYVRTVRLRQQGELRLGGAGAPWKPFAATQFFTVDPPGFVWDAAIDLAPLVPVRVVDAYRDGEGSLRAKLLSTVTVAEAEPGPDVNAGELLRYLAESVWFPTALLPGGGVEWEPVDDRSVRATLEHRGATASLVFRFDDRNLVERVAAEGRYRQEEDAYRPWTGYFRDYRNRNGTLVPTDAEVEWNLPGGDLPYWRGRVAEIEHRPGGRPGRTDDAGPTDDRTP